MGGISSVLHAWAFDFLPDCALLSTLGTKILVWLQEFNSLRLAPDKGISWLYVMSA